MSYEVDKLMSAYSSLSEEDTQEFDHRYKQHKQFSRAMNSLVKQITREHKTKQVQEQEKQ